MRDTEILGLMHRLYRDVIADLSKEPGPHDGFDWHRAASNYRLKINDRLTTTFGRCSYSTRTIEISGPLSRAQDTEDGRAQVHDTILHEIAHAMTPGAGHGPAWKRACVRIGAKPVRCYSASDGMQAADHHRYQIVCTACDQITSYRQSVPAWATVGQITTRYHRVSSCPAARRGGPRSYLIVEPIGIGLRGDDVPAATGRTKTPVAVAAADTTDTPQKATKVDTHLGAGWMARDGGPVACHGCGVVRPRTKYPTRSGDPSSRKTTCRGCPGRA